MKKLLAFTALSLLVGIQSAEARKLSMMEWMDPTSMSIWQELPEAEKVESLQDFMAQSEGNAEDAAIMKSITPKIRSCLDKEVADPDYKGTKVPLMVPMGYCMTKYMAIAGAYDSQKTEQ